jgi:hypothetical protein
MMLLCGIGASLLYASPFALMKWLVMRFNGWIKRSRKALTNICLSSKVVLNSSMGFSLRFVNLETILLFNLDSTSKKMYYMNNMVINHCGFFIYLDLGYLCSFHNVNIMCGLKLYKNCRQFFIHTNEYFEYLFSDPSYLGKKCSLCVTWEAWIVLRMIQTLELSGKLVNRSM